MRRDAIQRCANLIAYRLRCNHDVTPLALQQQRKLPLGTTIPETIIKEPKQSADETAPTKNRCRRLVGAGVAADAAAVPAALWRRRPGHGATGGVCGAAEGARAADGGARARF
eukprot:scaffold34605_cov86-Phaeocystis_antarctica.AAC.1